jgi:peptidoglycan hydrolase CwlO-like protein
MEYESNADILRDLMNNIRTLHEENAKLKQHNDQLCDINLKVSQERDDLNVEKNELNRKLKSIQSLFL